jgi:hypothetical protein
MSSSSGRFIPTFSVGLWLLVSSAGIWAQAPAAAPEDATAAGPVELLKAGNAAYLAQNWAEAAKQFDLFLESYASEPTAAEAVAQVKPCSASPASGCATTLPQGNWSATA